ncbi:hypothetical protein ACFWMR_01860 [Amycolatopsis thailandensis]|uniref:hypothetical protein n=1 Tax=Amycolatopsis thailandensis TaxID=589330 RepID=UPI0036492C5F
MADDFKMAGAYVEVHLRDHTEADEKRIRTRLENAPAVTVKTYLDDPRNTKFVKERIGRSPAAKIRTDADVALADARIRELAARRTEALVTIDADMGKAKARIAELEKQRGNTKLDVDAEISKAKAKIDSLKAKRNRLVLEADVDEGSIRNAADKVDSEMERVARRANASFDALMFAGLSIGLPAAAAVGAVGATAAIALVPAALVALSVATLKNNKDIKASWEDTTDRIVTRAGDIARVMGGPIQKAATDVGETFTRLEPQLERAFDGAAPSVDELVGSVTDLASEAMPGLVVAAAKSETVLKGVRDMSRDTGAGLSDMFFAIGSESKAAGTGVAQFGDITRDMLGFVGEFLANLASGSTGTLPQFRGTLLQVEDVVLSLTGEGMPALQGATSGFLGTVSGGLSIVSGLVSILGHLPPQVTELGGAMLAVNSFARLFGTSLAETGFGLRAFSSTVDAAGNRTTPFKEAMADAERNGSSKFRAGMSTLVSSGINPLGIALVAGGALLDLWGKKSQEAATRAAEQKQSVNDLTRAYIADGNAVGANVRATTQKALSDQNAYRNSQVFGQSLTQVSSAALGNKDALNTYNATAKDYIRGLLSGSDANREMIGTVLAQADAFAKQGGNATDVVDGLSAVRLHSLNLTDAQRNSLIATLNGISAVNGEARAQAEAAQKAKALADAQDQVASIVARGTTPAMYSAQAASNDLTAAWEALNTAGGDVAAKGKALIDVMLRLSGQTPSVEEAMQAWNDSLRGIGESFKGLNLKGHSKDLIDASGAINTTSEAGSKLQDTVQTAATQMASYGQALKDAGTPADEIRKKLEGMEGDFAKQLRALGLNDKQIQQLVEHYGLIPDKILTNLKLEGDVEAQKQLTDIVGKLKDIPPQKGLRVEALTDTAIKALADLGYSVVKLPDGTFQVYANTEPGRTAAQKLLGDIGNSDATTMVYANTQPAGEAVNNWKNTTSSTEGRTTTYTNDDPATGVVRQWKVTTDATGARTVTYSNIDPATGAVRVWKQNADGTWAETHARADVGAAEASLNHAARDRTAFIRTITVGTPGGGTNGGSLTGRPVWNAQGNILKFYAGGGFEGLTPMASLASMVPSDTWRVVGDNPRFPEAYIPMDPTSRRSQALLDEANTRMGRTAASRNMTINNNVTIHTQAYEPQRVAAAVFSELAWQMRGG